MNALVLYDSAFGNTEQIAKSIGEALGTEALYVGDVNPGILPQADFMFVGSPTQSGRATPLMSRFLDKVPKDVLKKSRILAFDTRLPSPFVGIFGFAAVRIAASLTSIGAPLVSPPEGFFVKGKKGPLKEGERERAASWAQKTISLQLRGGNK